MKYILNMHSILNDVYYLPGPFIELKLLFFHKVLNLFTS